MRFHTLRLTAVGPFPGTEIIDFDALGADGLFLLHGRTGAGKTTVLDAITFALYGEVPGHRRTAGMKSTHAPADREPWVELEFTLGQVRWNIRRRAAFDRPKKRGTGTVRENAKLLLSRREGEDLVPVSDNIQGAAAEIRQLMPLSMAQFTKVILLPQGEFAEFLHASSLEKQEVLQKLFDTRIYQDLQWRLAEDAKDYRRRDEELGTRITEQTSMLRAAAQELLASTEPPSPASSRRTAMGESSPRSESGRSTWISRPQATVIAARIEPRFESSGPGEASSSAATVAATPIPRRSSWEGLTVRSSSRRCATGSIIWDRRIRTSSSAGPTGPATGTAAPAPGTTGPPRR